MTRSITRMTLKDAAHYSDADRAAITASTPEWERDARIFGLPGLGSGAVFPIKESDIRCEGFEIPRHFAQIIGVDFGYDHPFAACRCVWDRDSDVFYVVATYRESGASAPIHAAALRPWGLWIPIAWPHDGLQHDKGSGDQLAGQYRSHGLNMLPEHATHEEGGFGLEAGVQDMLERMQTGRWKVFTGNESWFEECRLYHREDWRIVKERDDLLSGSRYALMMKRFANTAPRSRERVRVSNGQFGWMS